MIKMAKVKYYKSGNIISVLSDEESSKLAKKTKEFFHMAIRAKSQDGVTFYFTHSEKIDKKLLDDYSETHARIEPDESNTGIEMLVPMQYPSFFLINLSDEAVKMLREHKRLNIEYFKNRLIMLS
jgi:hypothetical protein